MLIREYDDGIPPVALPDEPDAHGQAALMLGESLLHMLVERDLLTQADAVATVEMAAEIKVEVASAAGESKARMMASLALLERISISLGTDDLDERDGSNVTHLAG